jgi:hypothetical protein
LLFDDLPIDRPGQDRLQVGVLFQLSLVWPVKPLFLDVFQARQQRKAQQIAKREADFALPVGVQGFLADRWVDDVSDQAVGPCLWLPSRVGIAAGLYREPS